MLRIDGDFRRSECRGLDEGDVGITDQLACDPQEGFLEIVVTLRRKFIVLQRLLSVEGDGLGLDFAILDIYLVSAKDNGNVFTNTREVAMPLWDILVGHTTSHVKHDDRSVTLNAEMVDLDSSIVQKKKRLEICDMHDLAMCARNE